MSRFSGERLFTNPIFAQESRIADQNYSQELRRRQDVRETAKAGLYCGMTFGTLGVTAFASWKIGEFAGNDLVSGNYDRFLFYPVTQLGLIKGQQYLLNIARRFRPKD